MGQTLHITEGVGLIRSRGGEVVEVHPGQTISTPPGQWHWHGAALDLAFARVMTARAPASGKLAATEAQHGRLPEVRQLARRLVAEQQFRVQRLRALIGSRLASPAGHRRMRTQAGANQTWQAAGTVSTTRPAHGPPSETQ